MQSVQEILSNLPDSYKSSITDHLRGLAIEAVTAKDEASALSLLAVVRALNTAESAPLEPTTFTKEAPTRYGSKITKDEIERMGNVIKQLTKPGITYSSTSLQDLVKREYIDKLTPSLQEDMLLPRVPSQPDRPKWKELTTRTLQELVAEGYLERPENSKYQYTVVEQTEAEEPKFLPAPPQFPRFPSQPTVYAPVNNNGATVTR